MMNLALPMDLLTASHHHHHSNLNHLHHHHQHHPPQSSTRLYNSPPPISNSDPTVNDCKLIEYRGKKLVSFTVTGEPMLCLPQAVDIFLKNYVGGPHTVYCKLKRLDIVPLVCNTEQIRVLRGLGVLQPGVNRCKLLSCKDFDILLDDCENASKSLRLSSSRPGRPPKRGPLGLSIPTDYLTSNHTSQMKKHRLENGEYPFENGHLMEKSSLMASVAENSHSINHMASFMHLNNFPGLISRIANNNNSNDSDHHTQQPQRRLSDDQLIGLKNSTRNEMEAIIRSGLWPNSNYQSQYEDMVKHLERMKEEQRNSIDDCNKSISSEQKLLKDFIPSSNDNHHHHQLRPILNLSKNRHQQNDNEFDCQSVTSEKSNSCQNLSTTSTTTHPMETALTTDTQQIIGTEQFINKFKTDNDIDDIELNNNNQNINLSRPASSAASHVTSPRQNSPHNITTPIQSPSIVVEERTFSMEVLLRNIQALLKIATDNAMQHEKQIIYEKAELKMDVLREKEVKDSIEKKLMEERKLRVLYQKRYRKERKLRTRLG